MKKYFYFISFILVTIIGLSSCNSDEVPPPLPPPPPIPIEEITEDDLIGDWEIFNSEKQIIRINSNGTENTFPNFRTIDYDGFVNKFYKDSENRYIFENLNVRNEVIDKGTYSINDGTIVLNVTKHNGKDTSFVSIDNIATLYKSKEILTVFKYFTVGNYKVKDGRSMRNMSIAPTIHPGVEKLNVAANLNKLLGKWEVYDYELLQNGKWDSDYSKKTLAKLKGNTYIFNSEENGKLTVDIDFRDPDKDGIRITGTYPAKIVDDLVYYFVDNAVDTLGNHVPTAPFLWVTDWKKRTDKATNQEYDTFINFNKFRTDKNPDAIYEIRRYLKKVE